MKTQIILSEDIPALGHVGDIIEVSAGYARNHLFPLGKATPFSEEGIRAIQRAKEDAETRRLSLEAEYCALAKRLESLQLTYEERVNATGHLYGAVTAKRIADSLQEQGFDIPESHVRLAEPIRAAGEFEVPIHIHGDLNSNIKVWVLATETDEAMDLGEDDTESSEETAASSEAGAE